VPRGDGPFFSVTNGVQSIGADAQPGEENFYRFSASFAQDHIVGIRAAVIAMPFDSNRYIRIRSQIFGLAV